VKRLLVFFSCLVFLGCEGLNSAATYVGLRNPEPEASVEIDLICDYGGSPCTPERLRLVAESAFDQVSLRPGSAVRLWWMANTLGESIAIATYTVPPVRGTSVRAREAHRASVIRAGTGSFERAAAPLFRDFERRRSPILESLGKVALASQHPAREVWLVSNLLEESIFRLECDRLPQDGVFRSRVAEILPPGSLRGARVVALYSAPDAIDRCPVSVERFRAITSLYESAISQAGGRFVLSPTAIPTIPRGA
jgi:hypothetical protein